MFRRRYTGDKMTFRIDIGADEDPIGFLRHKWKWK